MKKNYLPLFLMLLFASLFMTSCNPSNDALDIIPDELSEFSAESFPLSTDRWEIIDSSFDPATGSSSCSPDVKGLEDALVAAKKDGREIEVIFTNLKSVPYAGFRSVDGLVKISLPVATSISERAFYECSDLESVSLPEVTSISDFAFYYSNISTITAPKLTTIGAEAFEYCLSLENLTLDNVTTIGKAAFENCNKLLNVSLPNATSLENNVFASCGNLTTISLPKLTSVPQYTFGPCESLKSLELATDDNAKLEVIYSTTFYWVDEDNITLTLGSMNSEYVDGNILSIGDYKQEFKEIIIK